MVRISLCGEDGIELTGAIGLAVSKAMRGEEKGAKKMTLITRKKPNVLEGAIVVSLKESKKVGLGVGRIEYKPAISAGYNSDQAAAMDITVNGEYAGMIFFSPTYNHWYYLVEKPPIVVDGSPIVEKAGKSKNFEDTVRDLLRSCWPEDYRELVG